MKKNNISDNLKKLKAEDKETTFNPRIPIVPDLSKIGCNNPRVRVAIYERPLDAFHRSIPPYPNTYYPSYPFQVGYSNSNHHPILPYPNTYYPSYPFQVGYSNSRRSEVAKNNVLIGQYSQRRASLDQTTEKGLGSLNEFQKIIEQESKKRKVDTISFLPPVENSRLLEQRAEVRAVRQK